MREQGSACANEFGGPVLELATGTGRVLWPIAGAGFEIAGLDISAEMLAAAKAKARQQIPAITERARFHELDMTSFDLGTRFRLALIPYRAFHYLTRPAQQRAALQCINRSLLRGGHLVVDVFDPQLQYCVSTAPPFRSQQSVVDLETNHTIIRRFLARVNDPLSQIFTERFRIEEVDEQGRVLEAEETAWTFRWNTRQEMRYLFELSGFEVVAEYSDFYRSPPAYGTEQVWIVRKSH